MQQLIFGLIIISGIGALLALLIEVAYAYIADYGESHILVNDEKDFVVQGGSSLLSTLKESKIYLPSGCGGKGTCSLCKLRVLDGAGPVLPTETPYLSNDEMEKNVRLSCQVKVRNDLKIIVPDEIFLVKEFRIIVDRIDDLTPEIKRLQFSIITPEEGITFKPGQYVQLEIPKYKLSKSPEFRAYSVASGSEDHHHLELIITRMEQGIVSTYVHDYLKPGQELKINGPYGDFYLRDSNLPILLIATGSGIAPIRSLLYEIKGKNIKRDTTLFFGSRTRKDLAFYDELMEMEKQIPNFTFFPTLSRSTDEDKWEGEKGRVTDLIEKRLQQNTEIEVYICGSPVLVNSCVKKLSEKGTPEECIYYDKFE